MGGKFYITTPIYYVNDRPHIGHAYTTIAADAVARYQRLLDKEVVFLTGTDENAQKTVDAAAKSGEEVRMYAERLANIWKSTWSALHISNTDFIRTTEERHIHVVREVWKRIWDNGDIYKGKYEGLYCKGHEAFMKETDLVDGLCPDHNVKPEWIAEENYFFRLKKYEKDILEFYDTHPDFVTPAGRFQEVKSFVRRGLEDISVSREKQEWGIPVPNDPKHVIYVWFDALINYISAVGLNEWQKHPADIHAVGKDITRFHAVIWPAMLLSAKLPLPKQIMTNGFLTINGVKISKSLGNAIDPVRLAEKYGVDALRYFLLREIPYGEDGDFSEIKFKERYNADLANGLGNLLSRTLKMSQDYFGGQISESAKGRTSFTWNYRGPKEQEIEFFRKCCDISLPSFLEKFHFERASELISFNVDGLDAYIEDTKPYRKVKESKEEVEGVLWNLLYGLYYLGKLSAPFMPETSERIQETIGAKLNGNTGEPNSFSTKLLSSPLFPRK